MKEAAQPFQPLALRGGLEKPTWFEVRAALLHAQAASMDDIAREAANALLGYGTSSGHARLAREAAEALTHDALGATWWYPYFILGKCARLTDDLEAAIAHYANAETYAANTIERDIARYERASALWGLGKHEEAARMAEEADLPREHD